jgi:hypothetical protein
MICKNLITYLKPKLESILVMQTKDSNDKEDEDSKLYCHVL